MKKYKISIMIVLLVSLIGITLFSNQKKQALNEITQFREYGEIISNNVKEKKEKKALISQNSNGFDKYEFESLKAYYKNFFPDLSDKQVVENALNDIITETTVISEASQLGLAPSETDVLNRVKEERKKFENASGEDNEKVKEMIKGLIEGLGITEDEYWETVAPYGYVYTISEERLFQKTTEDIEDLNEKIKKWEATKQKFVEDYKIKHKQSIEEFKLKYSSK